MIIDGRNIPDLVQNSVDRLIKGCNEDDILVDCYMSELQANELRDYYIRGGMYSDEC